MMCYNDMSPHDSQCHPTQYIDRSEDIFAYTGRRYTQLDPVVVVMKADNWLHHLDRQDMSASRLAIDLST